MADSVEVLSYDFEIPVNGDYQKTWSLRDKATGDSLLADTALIQMDLKTSVDRTASPVISLMTGSDTTVSGIVLAGDVGTSGEFTVTIRRADLEDDVTIVGKKATLFYDLAVKFVDGFVIIYAKGKVTVDMGVTDVS